MGPVNVFSFIQLSNFRELCRFPVSLNYKKTLDRFLPV